jgi:transaldolase
MTDALAELSAAGVSVWLDDISRERLVTGNLADLVANRHVVGVTSNPTIFAKALEKGDSYTDQLRDLALRGVDLEEAVRALTTFDIRWACDVLLATFERTGGLDGRVSLEVDPRLARDEAKTVAEARALAWMVDRPSVFIKIPATREGLPAITATLARGISVNVTLIFALDRYDEVMDAFFAGLEQARDNGHDLSTIASVASFFVSRMDTEVDKRLDKLGSEEAKKMRGKAAIANARLAYERYEQKFDSDRWRALEAAGARRQRPLWASTSTKDPAYEDTMYVVELVAPGTVNTMPAATVEAVADHGRLRGADTACSGYDQARKVFDDLAALGIGYDDVAETLEVEGVQKFADSWKELLESVSRQLAAFKGDAK